MEIRPAAKGPNVAFLDYAFWMDAKPNATYMRDGLILQAYASEPNVPNRENVENSKFYNLNAPSVQTARGTSPSDLTNLRVTACVRAVLGS